MQQRPTFIDLRSMSSDTMHSGVPSPRAFHSPRMQHLDGDIPPAMSPLDMFAAQSRLLARQLDQSKRNGRRVSRLPPLTTTDPITKQQTNYQRSRSADQSSPGTVPLPKQKEDEPTGTLPELEEPQFRPKSFYPRMSHVPPEEEDEEDKSSPAASSISAATQPFLTPVEQQPLHQKDDIASSTSQSPESNLMSSFHSESPHRTSRFGPSSRSREQRFQPFNSNVPQREMSIESNSSKSQTSLAPPKSPHHKQASIRSIPVDSSDDDHIGSPTGSAFSRSRQLSSSSNFSTPSSPHVLAPSVHGRSPSLNSEYSIGGSQAPRPSFNFSRPISRASQPSLDMPRQPSFDSRPSMDKVRPPFTYEQRQASSDSQSFLFVEDATHAPVGLGHDSVWDGQDSDSGAPSYVYSKFSLPRGRLTHKDSKVLQNGNVPIYEWDRPKIQSNVRPTTPLANRPMSPPSPPQFRTSPRPSMELRRGSPRASPRPSFEQRTHHSPRPSFEQRNGHSPRPSVEQRSVSSTHPSAEQPPKISFERAASHTLPSAPVPHDDASEYTSSTRSASTIKARPRQIAAMSTELTPEDHLAKGVALHERGEDREATYHFRIAAKADLPFAMLMYGLAHRHGWGIRENPGEAFQWLKKAADCASQEVKIDDDTNSGDVQERKTLRAQYALSLYELGQSYYKGWGTEKNRVEALKCFETAAKWGDTDAMAEAGFCYVKGEGCKKDMKKAAKYYRMAEAKGVSMVGNSW